MEKKYSPTEEEVKRVELYSHETNEMLGDMPGWLIHTGSYIVYGIMVLLIAGAAWVKYPDTVEQTIKIDDTGSMEWITANRNGMIDRFFVEDQAAVERGDTLGILKNGALLQDVKRFCKVLTHVEEYYRTNNIKLLENYPFDLIMGDMASDYEQFTQAVRTCLMHQEFDIYPQKRKFLDEELKILTDNTADKLALLKVKRELFELEINHKMETGRNMRMLELAYEGMVNSLRTWDANYLIKCRNNGTVVLGRSWGINRKVMEGDTLCTVVSKRKGKATGHIRLTEAQVSDIRKGDKVNIELNKYPSHSYGKLPGCIASISFVPRSQSYAVEVEFPDGLITVAGKEIDYGTGLSGRAEIVTSSRSILNRVFEPVMQIFKKQS